MVVQSLDGAVAPIQSSIVLGGVVPQHSMVPRAEKSSECKMSVKNSGGKGAKKSAKDTPVQRRASARIQAAKQKAEEELQARREAEEELQARREAEVVEEDEDKGGKAAKKGSNKRARNEESVGEGEVVASPKKGSNKRCRNEESVGEGEVVVASSKKKPKASAKREVKLDVEHREKVADSENAVADSAEKGASLKVKETIRLYNKHYLHFVQVSRLVCAIQNPLLHLPVLLLFFFFLMLLISLRLCNSHWS